MESTLSGGLERAEHVVAAKVNNIEPSDRLELLNQLLSAEEVDVRALGRLAVEGITPQQQVRALVWKVLLGYLPPQREQWETVLKQRRQEYQSFCSDFMINPSRAEQNQQDEPLSQAEDSSWAAYFRDLEEYDQIKRDLERTHQTLPFFSCDEPSAALHRTELARLLFVFSKLNSGLKYVQGMNEVAAPLYMVFRTDSSDPQAATHAEADTFFCFVRVLTLSETRDLYCKTLDTATTGVVAVMKDFLARLNDVDPTVASHLEAQKVDPHYFAFRWLTVLFSQDIDGLQDVLRVWDFLFGDARGCKDAVMRFACALLLRRRTQLLSVEFPEIIKVLQSCGRDDFDADEAISIASSLSAQYIP